mmetsp:Transcript_10740/g.26702  ORF Transcript_10740/g.26702 Transcript_10740/m.26702 type:complete len:215 (-) Transcript_10740:191-835(-)
MMRVRCARTGGRRNSAHCLLRLASRSCRAARRSHTLQLPPDRLPSLLLQRLADVPDPRLLPLLVSALARQRAVPHDGSIEADQELGVVDGVAERRRRHKLGTNVPVALLDHLAFVCRNRHLELRVCLVAALLWLRRRRDAAVGIDARLLPQRLSPRVVGRDGLRRVARLVRPRRDERLGIRLLERRDAALLVFALVEPARLVLVHPAAEDAEIR